MKKRILIVDDEPAIQLVFKQWLQAAGFDGQVVATIAEARRALDEQCFDGVILDNVLPDGEGVDFIEEIRSACPAIAIIVITGMADIPLAVEAMYRGADNFLAKPLDLSSFEALLLKSLELSAFRRLYQSRAALTRKAPVDFGISAAMRAVMEVAGLAAGSEVPVLVSGETGVGKGVLARWVHESSMRSSRPFVDVNCSVLRGDLLASELFGHAKGAFTSAIRDREGLVAAADEGTLFLDEIGDMEMPVQAQLLKVIEEKTFRRMGEVRLRRSDFRLICATNRDLEAEAAQGRFRKDLLYRIKGLSITLSPLRERREDIPGLVRHILARCNYAYRDVSGDVLSFLGSYSWPGNVRELQNILERAVIMACGGPLMVSHFSGIVQTVPKRRPDDAGHALSCRPGELARLEQQSLRSAMARFGGNVDQVAALLGISRSTVYRKLKRYGLSHQ